MNDKLRVGITHGDTNGIGYETILRLLADERIADIATIIIYGSAKAAAFYRKALELAPVQLNRIDSAPDARDGAFNIINVVGEDLRIEPGTASAEAGAAALAALDAAVADLRAGAIDALVTCPIDKHTIQSETFAFPGHTEYLEASLTDADTPDTERHALMILATDTLRVALATAHLPIAKVPEALTQELIADKLARFDRSLRRDFGVDHPRIAVLALNPHAGESGLLGDEEEKIIAPAIAAARADGIQAFGPYAADGFFGAGHHRHFDGVLAMYHDQGLAPFKTLAMDNGVNFTAGLPAVRTSPDHGTGYDIAGKGMASEASLRSALYMAVDVVRCRARYDGARRRSLRRQNYDKGRNGDPTLDLSADS